MSNPFLSKKDPLVEAVKKAQEDGQIRRQAIAIVNEEFGVYNRNALVREDIATYDARIEEAYEALKEGKDPSQGSLKHSTAGKPPYSRTVEEDKVLSAKQKKMAALGGNPNKIDAPDLAKLRKGAKLEDVDYSAPDRAAVTKDNKPSVSPAATKADTSGPSAADKAGLAAKIKAIREAKAVEASNEVTAPKDYSEPRKPNKNAVTKAPVPGVSIAEDQFDEAAYSAKAGRAGKDLGKPGKMFSKIAKKAGEKYGSEERGKKVAGAILAKIRAKHMKEDQSFKSARVTESKKLGLDKTVSEDNFAKGVAATLAGPSSWPKALNYFGKSARTAGRAVDQSRLAWMNMLDPEQAKEAGYKDDEKKPSSDSKSSELPPSPVSDVADKAIQGVQKLIGTDNSPESKERADRAAAANKVASDRDADLRKGANTPGAPNPATDTTPPPKSKTSTPAPTPDDKPEAKAPETSSTTKPAMSFSQAYRAAREKGGSKAQFQWTSPKTGKTGTFQAAATKKEYVPMSQQTKVDIGTSSTPTPAPTPAAKPAGIPAVPKPTSSPVAPQGSIGKLVPPSNAGIGQPSTGSSLGANFAKQPPSSLKEEVQVGNYKYRIV